MATVDESIAKSRALQEEMMAAQVELTGIAMEANTAIEASKAAKNASNKLQG